MVRPFCNKFLLELSEFYELVIFTAAMQDYADWIIQGIDQRGLIKHRLYRQHCQFSENGEDKQIHSVKDLRLLGRDIRKTIIIDNLKENFMSTCPNNGIEIKSWYGEDLEDCELKKLIPFLKGLVVNEEKDVRKVIKYYGANFQEYVDEMCMSGQTYAFGAKQSVASNKSGSIAEQIRVRQMKRKLINSVTI